MRSGLISLAGTAARAAVQIAANVIVARILGPGAYGVAAVVLGLAVVLELVRSSGLAAVVLRSGSLAEPVVVALHRASICVGVVLGAVVALAGAVLLSGASTRPYGGLLLVIAVAFPMAGTVAVPIARMARQHEMGRVVVVESAAVVLAAGVAVGAASAGAGPIAVVVQVVVLWAVVALGVAVQGRMPRGVRAPWPTVRPLVRTARHLSSVQLISVVARAGDRSLVAVLFGSAASGMWAQAVQLVALPLEQIGAGVQRVAVPALAGADGADLRRRFRRLVGTTTLLVWPVLAVLGVLAGPVVALLFGPQWLGSGVLLPFLVVAGAAQAMSYSAVWYFVASGRSDVQLRWALVTQPVIVIALVVGSVGGVVPMAAAYASACLVLVVPSFTVATRGSGIRLVDLLGAVVPAAVAATAAAATAWVVHRAVPQDAVLGVLVPGVCAAVVALTVAVAFPAVRAARPARSAPLPSIRRGATR